MSQGRWTSEHRVGRRGPEPREGRPRHREMLRPAIQPIETSESRLRIERGAASAAPLRIRQPELMGGGGRETGRQGEMRARP
jgi:hypothetical protein